MPPDPRPRPPRGIIARWSPRLAVGTAPQNPQAPRCRGPLPSAALSPALCPFVTWLCFLWASPGTRMSRGTVSRRRDDFLREYFQAARFLGAAHGEHVGCRDVAGPQQPCLCKRRPHPSLSRGRPTGQRTGAEPQLPLPAWPQAPPGKAGTRRQGGKGGPQRRGPSPGPRAGLPGRSRPRPGRPPSVAPSWTPRTCRPAPATLRGRVL